jgi:hypothetical protein
MQTYIVSPTWREILINARGEFGDKVIYYFLNYHTNLGGAYFKSVFDYISKKDEKTDEYWRYITKKEVQNNPLLLKKAEYLTIKFPNQVEREISLYDFVFVICFFKFIYDDENFDEGHYYFETFLSEKELKDLRDNLIDLVDDEFAKDDMDYRHTFPFCNIEMMKFLMKGCLGYVISGRIRSEWSWVDNQFEDAGLDVSGMQGKLWFEEFWDPKDFKIKMMNWKRLPF